MILNIDIYTFNGSMPSDNWLFMGDSITHMALVYPASNIQNLVGSIDNGRWPAYIEDGTGGLTGTAQIIIASRLASFSGKYVALCYGTNDSVQRISNGEPCSIGNSVGNIRCATDALVRHINREYHKPTSSRP